MKRIGILGGTFDPVHKVHLELAQVALDTYDLDVVLFIPTGLPVRKLGKTHASATHRLRMLQEACQNTPGFEVSSLEVDRPEVTYTIETLRLLKERYGQHSELFLILGEDTATDLHTWKDSAEIAQLVTILYAKRPGAGEGHELPAGFVFLELPMPAQEISSSYLRTLLANGEDVSCYIPAEALAYIRKHALYA